MQRPAIGLIVAVALLATAGRAWAGDSPHFQAWIAQDGKRTPFAGVVHLAPAPFEIVFDGPPGLDYGALSSLDDKALAGPLSDADLKDLFQDGSAGAEDRNPAKCVYLFVNPAGKAAPLTWQYWMDGPEPDFHRFQHYHQISPTQAQATREVRTVMVGDSHAETPITAFAQGPLHMVLAGHPRGRGQGFVDAKAATLVFDRGSPPVSR